MELDSEQNNEPILQFRNYAVNIEKFSQKKTIANILNAAKTNLGNFKNISDYILKSTGYSDCSDVEEDTNVDIVDDEEMKKEKRSAEIDHKVKVKLVETGPRIDLNLVKIEEGFMKGNVVYHSFGKIMFFEKYFSKEK